MILFNLNILNRYFVFLARLSRLNENHLKCFVVGYCVYVDVLRLFFFSQPMNGLSITIEFHYVCVCRKSSRKQIFNFNIDVMNEHQINRVIFARLDLCCFSLHLIGMVGAANEL